MIMHKNSLFVVTALAVTALWLSPATAQNSAVLSGTADVPPIPSEPDAWPGQAVTDEYAARQGRAVLPFTQDQIETLGTAVAPDQARHCARRGRRGRKGAYQAYPPCRIPAMAPSPGSTFGAAIPPPFRSPARPARPGRSPRRSSTAASCRRAKRADRTRRAPAAATCFISRRAASYLSGNAVVKLAGLAEPIVLNLRGTGADADFHVEIRLGVPGPNADPGALARPQGFHAGDAVCCSACSAAPSRRMPSVSPSRAAMQATGPGAGAAICCW